MKQQPRIIVVGGGHAGIEAAAAASRMGRDVVLVTPDRTKIGAMSCNPAIGGLGKGHLVREIDALDGLMGRAADAAAIQYRLLNRRKGPAVRGPRAQTDRAVYAAWMQAALAEMPNLAVVEGMVADIRVDAGRASGVVLEDGTEISGAAVVLTVGTFLDGIIHIGDETRPAGRMGEQPSRRLATRLTDLGLPKGRLKTGTPPRLARASIDWDRVEWQPGDEAPEFLSFLTREVALPQKSCGITHTNGRTHEIISANLDKSAMYAGHISGQGPRYCPSIEDKVVRFADKDSHQIFLEPEGLNSDWVYPNGISTSLPVDVQEAYVRSIVGLERAEFRQPGYAIEYDYFNPQNLGRDLELPQIPGLYLAGQINGTTGYEEAGAQGLVAGINACRAVTGEAPLILSRTDSYIGVMIDDLVSYGVTEPYRMFTSRAEFRLHLRIDNADQRLTAVGRDVGVVGDGRMAGFDAKMSALAAARDVLRSHSFTSSALRAVGVAVAQDGTRRDGYEILRLKDADDAVLPVLGIEEQDPELLAQLRIESSYETYLQRQAQDVAALVKDEAMTIPAAFSYSSLPSLSGELREKLQRARPESIAAARRIEGMTPAALMVILAAIKQRDRLAS